MIRVLEHITKTELARFATAADARSPAFDHVRGHLGEGCQLCAQYVQGIAEEGAGSDWDEAAPGDRLGLVVPQRIVRTGGTRLGIVPDAQLICCAGPYELDVLVREMEGPRHLQIGGQVTRVDRIHEPVPRLVLTLIGLHGPTEMESAQTDGFGEFGFVSECASPYGLRLGPDVEAPCVLVWEPVSP